MYFGPQPVKIGTDVSFHQMGAWPSRWVLPRILAWNIIHMKAIYRPVDEYDDLHDEEEHKSTYERRNVSFRYSACNIIHMNTSHVW